MYDKQSTNNTEYTLADQIRDAAKNSGMPDDVAVQLVELFVPLIEETRRQNTQAVKQHYRDKVLDAVDELEKSELWAQMGISVECHGVYVEKFEELVKGVFHDK